ncbi:hypothetical protein LWI28_012818 [Acer negundo]|uniref:Myb-like domain-containing protein n=1 Tax=Acer negundo TaxID=4023 RepID=A0AAD5IEL1_ACENE|nr:hypothetical protein LWI28_012818 [Acer negundo]KAK4837860.1 hypothetical protein QYF36_009025 [Acer negundo]
MEVLTGERHSEFPQQIAPFPEPVDLTSAIDSVSVPPQKLRPIRRSPPEVRPRFLGEQIAYFDGGAATEVANLVESNAAAVEEDEESLGPKTEWCDFTGLDVVDEYSSSADDDSEEDLLVDVKEPGNRKRKRKTREKIETFMENLMMRIMDKQEEMNKQMIEMIEKREKERIMREDAWKQQEMERMKRDEEMRAQETSRSVALISFIQNVLGQPDIPIPQSLNRGNDSENHTEKDILCNQDYRKWPEACDSNRRWPEAEVQALIMLRTALEHKFRTMGLKCLVWDEISVGMRNMGYDRSAKKCKEKWENINKYYVRSMGNGKKHLGNSKACPYFHDLDVLYNNGLVSPGIASNLTNYENVGNTSNYETLAKTDEE